jgi:hypothetical protein
LTSHVTFLHHPLKASQGRVRQDAYDALIAERSMTILHQRCPHIQIHTISSELIIYTVHVLKKITALKKSTIQLNNENIKMLRAIRVPLLFAKRFFESFSSRKQASSMSNFATLKKNRRARISAAA